MSQPGAAQPTAAMVVIGDEILSGRTRDSNANHLACVMTEIGVRLTEVRMVADDQDVIVAAVNALRAANDYVFTSGGIGPTHDDITADAIAAAFGVHIDVREDAREILRWLYEGTGRELNEARLRMARIPDGAELIDNPVSGAPGFRLDNVYVMAGVPKIFKAMLDGVLAGLASGKPVESVQLRVERPEGEVAAPLGNFSAAHQDVAIGCYPFIENGNPGCTVVMRGQDKLHLDQLLPQLKAALGA